MAFKFLFALATIASTFSGAFGALTKRVACPGGRHTAINAACCQWYTIRDDLQENFFENLCGEEAHESLRLTFHDAIGHSPKLAKQGKFPGGGADGSIVVFDPIETAFAANAGIDDIIDAQAPFLAKYNVTPGDFIQFAGAVGVSNCPGAPRIGFLAGRPRPTAASPDGLIPEPFDTVSQILDRFADVGFNGDEVVALLASHTIAASDNIEPDLRGIPFDSTPSEFDSRFFLEVQLRGSVFPGIGGRPGEVTAPLAGLIRINSDHSLARDSRTSCTWQTFATNQPKMSAAFGAAMLKMSIIGQNKARLTDCSEVIQTPPKLRKAISFPAGKTNADIEQACATALFPKLPTDTGPISSVAPVPTQ